MKKLLLLFAIGLFTGCVDEFTGEAEEKATEPTTRSATESAYEYDYDALAKLFEEDIRLQEDGTRAYATYQSARTPTPFNHTRVMLLGSNSTSSSDIRKLLILVHAELWTSTAAEIERYAYDLHTAYGCEIVMETVSGGDHVDIKELIRSYLTNLNGTIFVGDLPAAWFEIENDFEPDKYRTWPCDLYFMDMDGTWSDRDANGIYDSHTGDIFPELFVGRISTKNLGTLVSEEAGLKRYFDKNHLFWSGALPVNRKSGLSYVDEDWAPFDHHKTSIRYLYGTSNYEWVAYGDPAFGRVDFLNRLKDNRYEFIQVSCHSSESHMYMSKGGIHADEIYHNGCEAIGYNLYCCSACNWTGASNSSGFLAGAYVFNANTKSLVAVGSTKTGSMLEFEAFYTPLGQGQSIGESLKAWWKTAGKRSEYNRICWFYGMTIIGDPLVNFHYLANNRTENQLFLNGFDYSNSDTHRFIFAKERITANDYAIPAGKQVLFRAPQVILNNGFVCPMNGSFTITH